MGMHKNFMDILNVLYQDETLLRLLYYPPKNLIGNIKDPLDASLTSMLTIDSDWAIRKSRIMKAPKDDDLTSDNPMCRIFVFAGRRSADNGNYAMANQNVTIDIFCHNSFEEGDLRITRILDRLNELFVSERITGISKMDFLNGDTYPSPPGYVGYRSIFKFGSVKK